jgi:ABC-type cobalamin/Fe3+-siderophores transport system ATPase subunit
MALSTTETAGFLDQFGQLLQGNKSTLLDGGLDVTNWITDTVDTREGIIAKDAEKDAARAISKVKTKESETANTNAYKKTSTRLDAVIGVLGKDTPAGKQAARLRSTLNQKPRNRANNQTGSQS